MKKYRFPKHTVFSLYALLFTLYFSGTVLAQSGTSSVRGTIVDPQGNVIPGATVTLTSIETNAVRTQNTTSGGVYAFELIPPGTYRLEVKAAGFKKALVTGIRALVAKPTEASVQLEVSAVAETVTVVRRMISQSATADLIAF